MNNRIFISITSIKNSVDISWRWTIVRFFVAIILLVAAILKAYQLATMPSLGEGILHARWFNIGVVEFELFFGIWLIFGLLPKLTWLASIGLFSIFGVVSCYKAISGEVSCGCFGNVTVNPWITMTFDVTIIGILTLVCPKPLFLFRENIWNSLRQKRLFAVILLWAVLAIPVFWFCLTSKTAILTESGQLIGNSKNVVLEPVKWIGLKFPLLSFLDDNITEQITTGDKNVVLFRFDCDECKNLIEKIQDKEHYIFIAVPFDVNNVALFSIPEYVSLSDNREWWVETPVIVCLDNGTVRSVTKSLVNSLLTQELRK